MRLLIQHRSHYGYEKPATLGAHSIRLRPAAHAKARVETYGLRVEPECDIRWQSDPYSNRIANVMMKGPVTALDITVELVVEIHPVNPFDFFEDERVSQAPFTYPTEYQTELTPFLDLEHECVTRGPLFEKLSASLPREGRTVDLLVALNAGVNQAVKYVIREESGVWTPEETLTEGRASCRDSAILLMALLRERGIAARFCSGYLVQLVDEGMIPDQPKGMDHDVADLHAWCEVFLPGAGWVGLDATSGLFCGEGHIALCCAAVPATAAPIDGTTDTPAEDVSFSMTVKRLGHEARPTMPYTDEVWTELLEGANRADHAIYAGGVTLTCGGEPTFNSRLHPNEPEWNTEALGPTKWVQGQQLAGELRERLAPGAATLYRQGKHYPGESLPRWAIEIIGRRDGGIVWRNLEGLKVEATVDAARRFAEAFAGRFNLGIGIRPAFEDPWRFLQDEMRLPRDVDPHSANLKDPEERRRLARVLDRGLATEAGFVLPLAHNGWGWVTSDWAFRRGRLYLIQGDSSMGLRLPLNSLDSRFTWSPVWWEQDFEPADPRIMTPEQRERERKLELKLRGEEAMRLQQREDAVFVTGPSEMRTAVCFEARGDSLFVFLPPVSTTDQWFELVRWIDETRELTGLDVKLEGYPPPPHPVLYRFQITPDPGVLEVNLPVSNGAIEYTKLVEKVFDAALHCGLHSEKYLLDGRMAGSGGGNHLTLGGPTALQSPFVNRSDLLASVLTFHQHHPSLAYMFNGLFVGPTSQSPRADEARHEVLYEMELAMRESFKREGQWTPPWLNDQLFRDLLVDLTGSTHRTEISIDKLFDWRTPTGRQGIVEFRAFEMPPHPRMVAAQMILVRSIVAALIKQPYKARLVRWGQRLHDQYLLPYWMWRDFQDVLSYLAAAGFPLPEDAYQPFVELRCPVVGRVAAGGVVAEVRNAIEPWNVLGEEATGFGTARTVDSSLERIEVRVEGLVPERHAVLVNGHVLPLRPTGVTGEYVGGIRFRAWAPPRSLQAHLGIHHPVRLDILDTWGKRAIGACAYHVWHPEGRSYDVPPLTRFEAAARRGARFGETSPIPYPVTPVKVQRHQDVPYTLDLRRFDIDRPMPEPEDDEP